ncbi:STAS domain-containing protein [Streptomyces phaeochromogenes]|uniref:STAS domain-containing protein n=1 Tax=Streptomyces phaeochromogenes TaxID=1923 RepID=A0ABZ1HQ82_STRPH|nr:STAS domain-containing protein [Streptomyces phaeochromogenes]WRZ35191.1 STAS domain-containing protein [Streptomyces phaeochromogenes]WSD20405.1 STAS domain-containing protein [Streptomyces phaeochromogenes]WSJ02903.1 STAS domain-containing protein [Streptomyces phaeochromogenes]WSS98667.1 STAS domain-containing protein [Streptomyces phaeochromogenes]WSW12260.1 STAS domain-containing protein [Streptomyces phaeochromogenes]
MPEHETAGQHGSPAREVGDFLRRRREQIAQRWADTPLFRTVFTVSRDEAVEAGKAVVEALAAVATAGRVEDAEADGFTVVREQLTRTAAARSRAGAGSAQVSNEVDALRPPVVDLLVADLPQASAEHVRECATAVTVLMGTLRLVVMESALNEGRALIDRQRMELLETATPVIRLWDGIVAVPLIGTLDSARSQVVMETLLESVVDQHARFAILDITGVPTVDSLVAQHLMKTVAAARLMGAECIVSGIRPAIAQTIVHLGLDLGTVVTRASLADALAYALDQQGSGIVDPVSRGAVAR